VSTCGCNLTGGTYTDAWRLGERLRAHPQVAAWTSAAIKAPQESLPDDLFAALRAALPVGTTIPPLRHGQPIVAVTGLGVDIATARSTARGSGAQLVPAWMIELAWDYLRAHGEGRVRRSGVSVDHRLILR
jgi:hypothetical protein